MVAFLFSKIPFNVFGAEREKIISERNIYDDIEKAETSEFIKKLILDGAREINFDYVKNNIDIKEYDIKDFKELSDLKDLRKLLKKIPPML